MIPMGRSPKSRDAAIPRRSRSWLPYGAHVRLVDVRVEFDVDFMADGPLEALRLVDALEEQLAAYHLWHATRADLLRRLDRADEAIVSYRRAHALAQNAVERRYLERRLAQLTTSK